MLKVLLAVLAILCSSSAWADQMQSEIDCLARNIYFEARNQSTAGMFAVGLVTLNRVKSQRFPDTFCEVVHQAKVDHNGNPVLHACHFSWYCDGKPDKIRNQEAYMFTYAVAQIIITHRDQIFDFTGGATHYHQVKVRPWWAKGATILAKIGDHVFLKDVG